MIIAAIVFIVLIGIFNLMIRSHIGLNLLASGLVSLIVWVGIVAYWAETDDRRGGNVVVAQQYFAEAGPYALMFFAAFFLMMTLRTWKNR